MENTSGSSYLLTLLIPSNTNMRTENISKNLDKAFLTFWTLVTYAKKLKHPSI